MRRVILIRSLGQREIGNEDPDGGPYFLRVDAYDLLLEEQEQQDRLDDYTPAGWWEGRE